MKINPKLNNIEKPIKQAKINVFHKKNLNFSSGNY